MKPLPNNLYSSLTCKWLITACMLLTFFCFSACREQAAQLRVATFALDASPQIGSPVAYAPARSIVDSLSIRGMVILSDEEPIVLCAVDWLGIANEGMQRWKESLAEAAGTSPERVSVHALHQHDGLRCDFTVEKILASYGLAGTKYDTTYLLAKIAEAAEAVKQAVIRAQPVTHLGFGQAEVKQVASNRRILGADGKVKLIRWSKSTDPEAIAAPEGLIDPWLKSVSFWNKDKALAVMTYYAVHPQSYYGQGDVTCEFVGIARNRRQEAMEGVPHIHFNGAGGNVAAGKYNDGSPERRPVLAQRMEDGMQKAWENSIKRPLRAEDLQWKSVAIKLPLGKHLVETDLRAILASDTTTADQKFYAAKHLAWLLRTEQGHQISISALKLDNIRMLNLPGEIFIEYQLAAQQMLPDAHVVTAAYEEYGMGYIGTEKAYTEGGYETSERASRVAPESEKILMEAIREVLR
jgi:hypothetical protein